MIRTTHTFQSTVSVIMLFICVISLVGFANGAQMEQAQQIRTEISQIIEDVTQKLNRLRMEHSDCICVVIVLGKSFEGKSALINCLAGKRAYARLISGNVKVCIDDGDPLDGITVHHERDDSETRVPAYWYDRENHTAWFDCAGLGGTNDARDIRNSYVLVNFLRSLLQAFPNGNIKFVLTTAQSSLLDSDEYFPKSVGYLCKLFNNDDISRHICLGILQASGLATEQARDAINRIILRRYSDGEICESRFMRGLRTSPIAFFPKPPRNDGPFLEGEEGRSFRERFFAAINETIALPLANPASQLVLSASARPLARQVGALFSGKIAEPLDQMIRLVVTACKEKISAAQNAIDLRRWLTNQCVLLNNITNETTLVSRLDTLLANFRQPRDQCRQLRINLDAAAFLDPSAERVQERRAIWLQKLTVLRNLLARLSKPKESLNREGVLNIEALFTGLSEIKRWYELRPADTIKTIRIFSSNLLLLDDDLTCPSVRCIFFAPCWKATKEDCVINLSGNDGARSVANAQAAPGADGTSGNQGDHGGHFFAKGCAEHVHHIARVTIKSSGGNGSDGTDGRDGEAGIDGRDGSRKKYIKQSERTIQYDQIPTPELKNEIGRLLKSKKVCGGNVSPQEFMLQQKMKIKYTPLLYTGRGNSGGDGGSGGKGGKGGPGGKAGEIAFRLLTISDPKAHDGNHDGNNGRDGKSAKGGPGGIGGHHCEGEKWKNVKVVQGKKCISVLAKNLWRTTPRHKVERASSGNQPPIKGLIQAPSKSSIPSINSGNEEELYQSYISGEKEEWSQLGIASEIRDEFINDME